MVKENNKTTNKSNKVNNLQIVKYIPRIITQIPQIPQIPDSFHLYLSINKFFVENKIYYQFYYLVLNNNSIDIIPNKNILEDFNIDHVYKFRYKTSNIYIYNKQNTQIFTALNIISYKIKTSVISVDSDSNENIFIKFFEEKKLFIKTDNLELVKLNKNNSDDDFDKIIDNFGINFNIG